VADASEKKAHKFIFAPKTEISDKVTVNTTAEEMPAHRNH
jgi:hypothetical protein